jgi:hypothetical protein
MEEQQKPEQKPAPKPAPAPAAKPASAPEQAAEKKTVADVLQTVSIALDTYDDIFSDFDPSPYEKRILSVDFLKELRRRYAENTRGEFAITFTLPRPIRSEKTEALVKKRIKDYFRGMLKDVEKLRVESMQKGALRLLIGVILSLLLLLFPQLDVMPVLTIVSVLIWYVLWTGFEYIFEAARRLKRKQAFYEKFLKAGYSFVAEEEVVRTLGVSSSYR